jgi:hypothetical protein
LPAKSSFITNRDQIPFKTLDFTGVLSARAKKKVEKIYASDDFNLSTGGGF